MAGPKGSTPSNVYFLTGISAADTDGRAPVEPSIFKGTSGGGGGNMLERIAKLESDVEYIKRDVGEIKIDLKEIKTDAKSDFRVLFGAIIFAAIGLSGIMAKGFGWI
jgi:hypothetical protein